MVDWLLLIAAFVISGLILYGVITLVNKFDAWQIDVNFDRRQIPDLQHQIWRLRDRVNELEKPPKPLTPKEGS